MTDKQINLGFQPYYYLTAGGAVINKDTNKTLVNDKKHSFKLKTIDNGYKVIALKTLYRAVFNAEYCVDNVEDIEGERWEEIKGTGGRFFISNKGRCKSYCGYSAAILTPYKNQNGYKRVDIIIDGSRTTKLLHKLVAEAFLGMPERLDQQIHHKDFDKNNCSADNLEYLTPAEHKQKHIKHDKEIKDNVKAAESAEPKANNC